MTALSRRTFGRAIPLSTGKVLVVGGMIPYAVGSYSSSSDFGAQTFLFDPATNVFAPVANPPNPRPRIPAVYDTVHEKVWICGGNNLRDVDIYDVATGTWSVGPQMNLSWSRNETLLLDTNPVTILSLGGYELSNTEGYPELYVEGQGWTVLPNRAYGSRTKHSVYNLNNGKVLMVGGGYAFNWPDPTLANEFFDIATRTFSNGPQMPGGPRERIATAVMPSSGEIWAAGGIDESGLAVSSVDIYNIAANSWRVGPPLPTPRCGGKLVVLGTDTLLYVGGGIVFYDAYSNWRSIAVKECWMIREGQTAWQPAPPLLTYHGDGLAALCLSDHRVLVFGGGDTGDSNTPSPTSIVEVASSSATQTFPAPAITGIKIEPGDIDPALPGYSTTFDKVTFMGSNLEPLVDGPYIDGVLEDWGSHLGQQTYLGTFDGSLCDSTKIVARVGYSIPSTSVLEFVFANGVTVTASLPTMPELLGLDRGYISMSGGVAVVSGTNMALVTGVFARNQLTDATIAVTIGTRDAGNITLHFPDLPQYTMLVIYLQIGPNAVRRLQQTLVAQ